MKRSMILSAFSLALVAGAPALAQDAATATDPNAGAYDSLSAGEKSIVDAIYESHVEATANETTTTETTTTGTTTANGSEGPEMMSPDDIAALKAEGGWGKNYNDLYDQGLVTHKNLGQAISAYKRSLNPSTAGTSATVVTTGSGQQIVTGGKKSDGSTSATSSTTGHGGGKKVGHQKNTVISSAGSGATTAGAASHSSAGGVSGFSGAGGAKGRGRGGASHKGN